MVYGAPLSKQFRILGEVIALLEEYFRGDYDKIKTWFTTENYQFGGISPLQMFCNMRGDKVLKFVRQAKENNGWELLNQGDEYG